MTQRRSISQKAITIFEKSGGKCWYCGTILQYETFHVDHFFPRALGGTNELENLVPSCASCNMRKGRNTVHEFRQDIRFRSARMPHFTEEQLAYLMDVHEVDVDPGVSPFWYERQGLSR
jgi:5-methylcytosine-specific restriction endonuclease McrA